MTELPASPDLRPAWSSWSTAAVVVELVAFLGMARFLGGSDQPAILWLGLGSALAMVWIVPTSAALGARASGYAGMPMVVLVLTSLVAIPVLLALVFLAFVVFGDVSFVGGSPP